MSSVIRLDRIGLNDSIMIKDGNYCETSASMEEKTFGHSKKDVSYVNSISIDSINNKHLERKGDSINI